MKTQLNIQPLTLAESEELKSFIGDCVIANRTFRFVTTRFGADLPLTIQELINSNVPTLQDIGETLEKIVLSKSSVSTIFGGKSAETYKISGVEATKVIEMLKRIITIKLVAAHREKIEEELKAAQANLSQFETNSEKKRKALQAVKAKESELNDLNHIGRFGN